MEAGRLWPSTTLCLNCSPTACHNERQPVYSGCAFSVPLQLSLYFPSMDALKKEDIMMLWYSETGVYVLKVWGVSISTYIQKDFTLHVYALGGEDPLQTQKGEVIILRLKDVSHFCLSPKWAPLFYSNCEKMLRSLFSRIEGNGLDLISTLCLMYMWRRGEHATSNITLHSCTGLDGARGKTNINKTYNI